MKRIQVGGMKAFVVLQGLQAFAAFARQPPDAGMTRVSIREGIEGASLARGAVTCLLNE